MCEGKSENEPEVHRRQPLRRSQQRRASDNNNLATLAPESALESPPPVATPTGSALSHALWELCDLHFQTPQHLKTLLLDYESGDLDQSLPSDGECRRGDGSTPPSVVSLLVVDGAYLVVGTDKSSVVIWEIDKLIEAEASLSSHRGGADSTSHLPAGEAATSMDPSATQQPFRCVARISQPECDKNNNSHPGRVVGLCLCKDSRDDKGTCVIAATDWGEVAVIDVRLGHVLGRFETGRCAAACVASLSSTPSAMVDEVGDTIATKVLVGYNTGILECWTLLRLTKTQHEAALQVSEQAPLPITDVKARLVALGMFEDGLPIRSLVPWSVSESAETNRLLGNDPRPTKTGPPSPSAIPSGAQKDGSQELAASAPENSRSHRTSECVMVTLESTRQVPAGQMVEVVDLASFVLAFSALKKGDGDPSSPQTIDLGRHVVLPEPGRELVDPSARTNPPPFPVPWVPSPATNRLFDLTNSLPCRDSTAACAFGLADGSVGIVAASSSFSRDGGSCEALSWGITSRSDQLLLSYPPVGLGTVTLSSPAADSATVSDTHYLACCLRGGTVYLVALHPTLGVSSDCDYMFSPRTLIVIAYPKDLDVDAPPVQQVQSFVAANINLTDGRCAASVPVLVYAWPGGIVDVYACQLQTQTGCPLRLLEQLVENGSVQLLRQILMESTDDILMSWGKLWYSAKDEVCKRFPPSTASDNAEASTPISVDDLRSSDFCSFRALLLQSANPAPAFG